MVRLSLSTVHGRSSYEGASSLSTELHILLSRTRRKTSALQSSVFDGLAFDSTISVAPVVGRGGETGSEGPIPTGTDSRNSKIKHWRKPCVVTLYISTHCTKVRTVQSIFNCSVLAFVACTTTSIVAQSRTNIWQRVAWLVGDDLSAEFAAA